MKTTQSERFSLNSLDYQKIIKDSLYFALIPLTFYITSVLGIIQAPNHVIKLNDFIPNNATVIAIVAWLGNQILNAIKKFVA